MSGGSYIAAARALVAHGLSHRAGAGARPDGTGEEPPYAPGTPEERNLRNNTHYLAPSASVVLAGVLSVLAGVVLTFIMAFAPLYALAHAWGWLLRWQGVLAPGRHGLTVSVQPWSWILVAATATVTLALFVWWRLALKPHDRHSGTKARLVGWGTAVTTALAAMTLGLPFAAAWLFTSGGAFGDIVHFFGFGHGLSWSPAALAGLLAGVAAVARACQAGLAKWQKAGLRGDGGLAGRAVTWLRQRLLPWLGSAVVVLLALACALLWTGDGATSGFTLTQLWPVLGAVVIMLITRAAADVNRMSLHDFYRWRLASAYAVKRASATHREDVAAAAPAPASADRQPRPATPGVIPDPDAVLSSLAHQTPELVICATANINAARETPPGQNGFCLAFDPASVTLHRGAGLETERAQASMEDYERLVGKDRLSLFDISAISGAAFSPLMGAATREAYRILFTVANLRLGVWLPHPRIVQAARDHLQASSGESSPGQQRKDSWWEHHPLLLLLWYVSPHPFWRHQADVGKEQAGQDSDRARRNRERAQHNEDREAKLWAHVLRRQPGRRGALWYRAMQPALGLLWAEAVGHTSYRSTWMYATDGGHSENLGLVEALRRGADRIIVLDASGDKAGTWFTLGGAIALARADAGVEISLDPTTMIRPSDLDRHKLDHGEVFRPWAHGTFTRRDESPELPGSGEIWVYKLGWWREAPWDVRAYAEGHPEFPGESTAEQLYDGAEFEAYRALGAAAMCSKPLVKETETA